MSLPTIAAAERNKASLLDALAPLLPATGRVLEIAIGTGQQVAHFAAALPRRQWLPSDADPDRLAVIEARTGALANVDAPRHLEVFDDWPAVCFASMDRSAVMDATPPTATGPSTGPCARSTRPGGCAT